MIERKSSRIRDIFKELEVVPLDKVEQIATSIWKSILNCEIIGCIIGAITGLFFAGILVVMAGFVDFQAVTIFSLIMAIVGYVVSGALIGYRYREEPYSSLNEQIADGLREGIVGAAIAIIGYFIGLVLLAFEGAPRAMRDSFNVTKAYRKRLSEGQSDPTRALQKASIIIGAVPVCLAALCLGIGPLIKKSGGVYKATARLDIKMLKQLLDKGANPNAKDNKPPHRTALHYASASPIWDIVQLLIDNGANVEARDDDGGTPLHYASANGRYRTVQMLTEAGANANARNNKGKTPLHLAATSGNIKVIEILLSNKAQVNVIDQDGLSPLINAVAKRRFEALQILIKNGADVNYELKNFERTTALNLACYLGDVRLSELLIDNGANVNIATQVGWTPLHSAAEGGKSRMVKFLLSQGAKPNTKDKEGKTPRDIAHEKGHTRVTNLLDQYSR